MLWLPAGQCHRRDARHLFILPAGPANSTGKICQLTPSRGICCSPQPEWTILPTSEFTLQHMHRTSDVLTYGVVAVVLTLCLIWLLGEASTHML